MRVLQWAWIEETVSMKKLIFMALFGVMVGAANVAEAAFLTGNELLRRCSSSSYNQGLCHGYIEGVLDEGELANTQKNLNRYFLRSKWRVCIPIAVRSAQLEDIVKKFLTNEPEIRHFSAASLVGAALANAFPCR